MIHQKCRQLSPLSQYLSFSYKGYSLSIGPALGTPPDNTIPATQSTDFLSIMSSSVGGTDFDSTAEMSATPGDDYVDVPPVGLSDPQYVTEKRRMLDAVNRLRATG